MEKELNQPLVSIVAICHNHAAYVLETLESIRLQTYKNIELIIINNLEDDCKNIIENWIRQYEVKCQFIQNQLPYSLTKNCNIGLSYVKGKYFQGISCDDILIVNKIEKQVEAFEHLKETYACIYSDMIYIDKDNQLLGYPSYMITLKKRLDKFTRCQFNYCELFSTTNPIAAPTVLLKTSFVKSLGGYDENYDIEDYSLNLELFKNGYDFFFMDFISVKYRILDNSLSMGFRYEKYDQVCKLLLKYKDILNVKNSFYQQKLFRGVLLSGNFFKLHEKYLVYLKVTSDYNPVRYFKLLYHFYRGTVHKKPRLRF